MNEYPTDEMVKVEWTRTHKIVLLVITLIIVAFLIYIAAIENISVAKCFSVSGLYVDILGVVIASRKTPYFGLFSDGGKLEAKRQEADARSFQKGMWVIAVGMLLQAIGTMIQEN